MPYNAFGLQEGLQVVNALQNIDESVQRRADRAEQKALQLEDREKAKKTERQTGAYFGEMVKNPDYIPVTENPDFNLKAWGDAVTTLYNSETAKLRRMQNNEKLVERYRGSIASELPSALSLYESDTEAGYTKLAELWAQSVPDGLTLERDAEGKPLFDPKTRTAVVKNMTGKTMKVQIPEPMVAFNQMGRMLEPGVMENMVKNNSEIVAKMNASLAMQGERYVNPNGEEAWVFKAYDRMAPGGMMTTQAFNIKTGEKLDGQQLARGKYEPTKKKDEKPQTFDEKLSTANESLKSALSYFGKGLEKAVDPYTGNVVREAVPALNMAMQKYEYYQSNPAKSLNEKEEKRAAEQVMTEYNSMMELLKSRPLEQAQSAFTPPPGGQSTPALQNNQTDLPQGVTEEDVQYTMQKYNMTRDQVLSKLKGK